MAPFPSIVPKPDAANGKGLIYLNPDGKVADSDPKGQIEWFVKNGLTVLVPDVIGTGELGPGAFQGDSYIDSVSYNLWFASMLIDRSIIGIQTSDVVRLTNLLKNEYHQNEVYGFAKKSKWRRFCYTPQLLIKISAKWHWFSHIALTDLL